MKKSMNVNTKVETLKNLKKTILYINVIILYTPCWTCTDTILIDYDWIYSVNNYCTSVSFNLIYVSKVSNSKFYQLVWSNTAVFFALRTFFVRLWNANLLVVKIILYNS